MKEHDWVDSIADWNDSIAAHTSWKNRFSNAIQHKKAIDANEIFRDDVCPLGKFLYCEGKAKNVTSSYKKLLETHARFHQEASLITNALNYGNFAAASAMIGTDTPYEKASQALVASLLSVEKEISERTTVYPIWLSVPTAWR